MDRSEELSLITNVTTDLFAKLTLQHSTLQSESARVQSKSSMLWRCLLPTENSPLSSHNSYPRNSLSASSRTHFVPSEDDLLMRGALPFEDDFTLIHEKLLPNKDEHALQFRFAQRTEVCSDNDNQNAFKRYQQLRASNYQRDSRWSLSELFALLKGFEVFGEKFMLINVYFLSHMRVVDIRNK